jgi:hypothetical protein
MFDLGILDVGIGLALVFLLVSLICSSIREAIESFLKSRAGDLERGVRLLLGEADGKGLTQKLFNQPLIGSLFTGAYDPDSLTSTKGIAGAGSGEAMPRRARQSLPSYIPAAHFASAVIDVVMTDAAGAGVEPPPLSVDSLRAAAGKISNDQVKGVILSAIDTGANDIAAVRASIETWFNGTMDRVSGWYKRRTQLILFVIGLATAVLLNVDAVTIAKRLSTDPALREVVVAQAGKVVAAGSPESTASRRPDFCPRTARGRDKCARAIGGRDARHNAPRIGDRRNEQGIIR